MQKILFIPGPSEVDDDVLSELSKPVIAHYGRSWNEFYNNTCNLVRKIFSTKSFVTLLPVPGMVSMEMATFNIVENDGDKVVNVSNGAFGELQSKILRLHGANVLEVESEYGHNVDIEKLKVVLDNNPDAKAIYLVHNETSTGVLNNVKTVGKIAKKYGKLFVVDAISSFGGIEFDFDGLGVDYAVGYASKCLGGINGVCPVGVSDRFMDYVQERKQPVKSYYFNMLVHLQSVKELAHIGQPHPTSMPTSVIRAFYVAAKEAIEEGLENRYERHIKVARAYRAAIRAMSLDVLPKEEDASPTVTVFRVPDGMGKKIRSTLLERFGFVIGGGSGKLEEKTIRIGHMGNTASPEYLIQLVPALELVLKELGTLETTGLGVEAAAKAL